MITLENVSKHYKVPVRQSGFKYALKSFVKRDYRMIHALDYISLKIDDGEMIGYIGPNGAGKSTTIKILSGILTPDTGRVVVNGLDPVKDRKLHAQRIGVVFGQRTQLWWDLPVGDSFDLLKEIYRIPSDAYKERLNEFVSLFELEDIIKIPVRQLSLGQRVRCDIVASLLHKPDVLFLDEPTIGLDAHSKIKVRELIRFINKKYGTTIILTTHDMQDIEQIVSRVVLIGHGTLLYDGSIDSLKEKYGAIKHVQLRTNKELDPHPSYTIIESIQGESIIRLNEDLSRVISVIQNQVMIEHLEVMNTSIDDVILNLYKDYQI